MYKIIYKKYGKEEESYNSYSTKREALEAALSFAARNDNVFVGYVLTLDGKKVFVVDHALGLRDRAVWVHMMHQSSDDAFEINPWYMGSEKPSDDELFDLLTNLDEHFFAVREAE